MLMLFNFRAISRVTKRKMFILTLKTKKVGMLKKKINRKMNISEDYFCYTKVYNLLK